MITEFYTLREMADKFRMTEETVRKKAAPGDYDFKAVSLQSGRMVFSAKEAEAVIDQAAREQHGFNVNRVVP